uniref:Uncharacterized protein n=1 Tax=Arundo donax TaxID=35708 RepID=A0A0A9DRC3_ARUDO
MRKVIYYDFLLFNIGDPQSRVPSHQIYDVLSMGITFDFLFPKHLTGNDMRKFHICKPV